MRNNAHTKTPAAMAKWHATVRARRISIAEIMEKNVIPEPNSGCWLWTAAANDRGYGTFSHNAQRFYAHRVALEARVGPLQPGECACHRCDNPTCVNPDHLFVGTHAENMRDAARKGRLRFTVTPKGETHHNAKLTREKAAEIKRRLAAGDSKGSLARAFGVTDNAIRQIELGRSWREA